MKKVLIIAYYWPPAGGPGVQRWLKFVTYLPQFEIEPIVYIPQNPHYPIKDTSFESEVPEHTRILRGKIWEPYAMAKFISRKKTQRISSGIITEKKPSVLEKIMLWIRGNFFIPDTRKFWVKPSARLLTDVIIAEKIETVITTGPPHSVHLIGNTLKQALGVKWIADFRDPWTTIGYHKKLQLTKRSAQKHRNLESMVLHNADQLITTSYITRDEFLKKTKTPITVITNGYDGEVSNGQPPNGHFTISHIGSLLSARNPIGLWTALSELIRENADFKESLRLQLAGVVSESVLFSLREHGLNGHTEVMGYLPHAKAIDLQRKSQILLLIEIDSPMTKGIIPGKLFEYMAAKRPILAIGPGGWDVHHLITENRAGHVFTYAEHREIKKQLLSWFQEYKGKGLHLDSPDIVRYHRKALTGQLAKLI
ncbi:MAG: glycosyltransferase family 4 protein [Flavobacteriaceae bacterium]